MHVYVCASSKNTVNISTWHTHTHTYNKKHKKEHRVHRQIVRRFEKRKEKKDGWKTAREKNKKGFGSGGGEEKRYQRIGIQGKKDGIHRNRLTYSKRSCFFNWVTLSRSHCLFFFRKVVFFNIGWPREKGSEPETSGISFESSFIRDCGI